MAFFFSPVGNTQFFDANGDPLVGGKLYTYLAGSTTPTATYTSNTGATPQANPIILNSLGVPANPIWLAEGISYKFVVKDSTDVTLSGLGADNIEGVNDAATSASEWVASGFVPTYLTATTFSVPGDQTDTLLVGRKLRTSNTAGSIYSRITVSSFGAGVTTVTVVNDSGVLDAGLSSVSYGLLSPATPSLPNSVAARASLGAGATGEAVFISATAAAARTALGGGNLLGVQIFTSTAVYTPTSGTGSVIVDVQAPGGGSGGCVATTAGQWAAGRSGAGGGFGRKRITSGFSGVTVTIGAAGTAGAAGDNGGGTGGTTSFGAAVSCTGGAGGGGSGSVQTAAGITGGTVAVGGAATGADLNIPGGAPASLPIAVANTTVMTAQGGRAHFGPGAAPQAVVSNNASGATPTGYGGGASGPVNANGSFSAQAGTVGAPGIVIVYEFA